VFHSKNTVVNIDVFKNVHKVNGLLLAAASAKALKAIVAKNDFDLHASSVTPPSD